MRGLIRRLALRTQDSRGILKRRWLSRRWSKLALSGLVSLLGLSASGSTPTTPSRQFLQLDSMSYEEICGMTSDGKTSCLNGGQTRVVLPDPVGQLRIAYATDRSQFGWDEEGLQFFSVANQYVLHEGKTELEILRHVLADAEPFAVSTRGGHVCAVQKKAGGVRCLIARTYNTFAQFESPLPAHAVSVTTSRVCLAVDRQVLCSVDLGKTWQMEADLEFNSRIEKLVTLRNWVCAADTSQARCARLSGGSGTSLPVQLPEAWLSARVWRATDERVCALLPVPSSTDLSLECRTDRDLSPQVNDLLPAYRQAGAWRDVFVGTSICVLRDDERIECWRPNTTQINLVEYSPAPEQLFSAGWTPCAILRDGSARCGSTASGETRSLRRADRVRVLHSSWSRCLWNSRSITCTGRNDVPAYREVWAAAAAQYSDALCVYGVAEGAPSSMPTLSCYGWSAEIRNVPMHLVDPQHLTVQESRACVIDQSALVCWGTAYEKVAPPNQLIDVKRLSLGSSHACAIDKFGLICWGDLDNEREVPAGLEDAGRVLDVAVGDNRSCAVLDDLSVQCWGQKGWSDDDPPSGMKSQLILGRSQLFCATDTLSTEGLRCWGGSSSLPR